MVVVFLVVDVIDSHPKIEEGHKKKDDGKKGNVIFQPSIFRGYG